MPLIACVICTNSKIQLIVWPKHGVVVTVVVSITFIIEDILTTVQVFLDEEVVQYYNYVDDF